MLLSVPTTNQQLTAALFEGITTFILMSLLGHISGAHFNPAITLAVGFVGHCRLVIGSCIIFGQFLGAFIASLFCRAFLADAAFNSTFKYGIPEKDRYLYANSTQAFFLEVIMSFVLCSAYLFTAVNSGGRQGKLSTVIVGFTRALVTYIGYRMIGHCANMAVSFGNAVSSAFFLCDSRLWSLLYIAVFANLIGAFLASLCYW
ncbi:unnamed protein product [Enterobius vermicularis]|uniref:Aquaporin n=1 Tax=Enterobius vermicularis TaxID=51028 RepID=A0A0N4VR73_ENTVE|nr:unnamed protein product [Enterobius vermicularis]